MKKWLYAAGFGLALTVSSGVQAAGIAVVNVTQVFQQIPQREAVKKQLENEFKDRAKDLQDMEKDLQNKMQRLRDGNVKESERNKLEKELNTKREQFATKAKAFEDDNRRRQLEERNKILTKIQQAVESVAKKGNYDLVIDANAVAYLGKSTKDITADVLKQVK